MTGTSRSGDGETYLQHAIGRHSPVVAETARAALRKLRSRFPGARILVYERKQSLPIGFAPALGGSALFSVVLYPRWVRFFFLEGALLDDPEGRLEGSGNQVRSIRVDEQAAILDEPYVSKLIGLALRLAGADLENGRGEVVIRSTLSSAARPAGSSIRNRPAGLAKRRS